MPYPPWQPIETAPRDGTWVLVHVTGEITETHLPACGVVAARYFDKQLGWSLRGVCGFKPTHWMPLPDPPTPMTMRVSDCVRMSLAGLVHLWLTTPAPTEEAESPTWATFYLYPGQNIADVPAVPPGKRVRVEFTVEDFPPTPPPAAPQARLEATSQDSPAPATAPAGRRDTPAG